MKQLFLIHFLFLSILLSGQIDNQSSESINIDTIGYGTPWHDTTESGIPISSGGYFWRIEDGFNQIVDTSGLLLAEGMARTRFKLGFLIHFGHGGYTNRIGLWTFYCNGSIVGHATYDKKGRIIGSIIYYENHKVKEIRYTEKARKPWRYNKTYFEDGREVITMKDTEEYINISPKEYSCVSLGP